MAGRKGEGEEPSQLKSDSLLRTVSKFTFTVMRKAPVSKRNLSRERP